MKRINWFEPVFDEEDISEVKKVLESAYVNEGPKTRELEEEIKKLLNKKYIIITTSATSALFLAVKADAILKEVKEFEVIIPDLTMIATATSVGWAGGKPILVDSNKSNFTIDVNKIEGKISEKTTSIIPVHTLGRSSDMDRVMEIAKKHNLSVIEDAAGALGSKNEKGQYLGTIGQLGCFSLQSNKIITCGQGGIIVTDNKDYYELIRRLRDFGRLNNKEFIHNIEGYNLKFNDLSAALALSQFRKLENKKRLLIKQKDLYEKLLSDIKEVKFPECKEGEIPLWVDVLAEKRGELISHLNKNNIFPRACWPAVHLNPPYAYNGSDLDFPIATKISNDAIWLPNGPNISDEDIKIVCDKILEFYNI